MTATATPKIKQDIIQKLEIINPFIYVDHFNRDNIFFKVVDNTKYGNENSNNKSEFNIFSKSNDDIEIDSKPFIRDYLSKSSGKSGIIYCSTRKAVEEIYNFLVALNKSVAKYHGGMGKEDRDDNQKKFLDDDVQIMPLVWE